MPSLLHATHLLGILSLSLAALAAARAAAIRRTWRWRAIAIVLALMAATIATDLVNIVHDAVDGALRAGGLYHDHAAVQWALMIAAAIGAAIAVVLLARGSRGAERCALLATIALAALFALQAISLHRIDAILSRPVGPVMTVALGWLAGAIAVIAAALAAAADRR